MWACERRGNEMGSVVRRENDGFIGGLRLEWRPCKLGWAVYFRLGPG
jgi:hypothetical protein